MPRNAQQVLDKQVGQKLSGIAGRLAHQRGDRSQRGFARDLGVFQQNINRYESGTTPCAEFLVRLAMKEKVDLNWLLLGKRTR